MKKLFTILVEVLLTVSVFMPREASAQAPQKMSYQAVIRDASNKLITSQAVGMKITILKNTTPVYVETQAITTNANGLATLEIGSGILMSGDFATIDWAAGSYFIKTETDPTGGTAYSITGTSQLLSVPYALYAKTAGVSGVKGDKGDAGDQGIQGVSGVAGANGAAGVKGDQGIQGIQGATGLTGAAGLTTSVNGVTQVAGAITLTKADIGLANIDN